nr:exopolysaccharide biosynthesis polyprenyl glycosylphosphotransferase [Roseivirga sp. E12]
MLIVAALYFISLYIAFGSFNLKQPYTTALVAYLIIWPILSYVSRDFKIGRAVSYYNTFKRAFTSVFIFVSLISLLWLFLAESAIDRHFIMSLILLLFVWLTIYRVSVHLVLDRYRTFGGNIRNTVIIGYDRLGFKLYDLLIRKPHYGIRCKGIFSIDSNVPLNENYPINGTLSDFFRLDLSELDSIYISDRVDKVTKDQLVQFADGHAKRVKLLPEIKTDLLKTFVLRRYDSVAVIDINNLPLDGLLNRVIKRSFDLVFALMIVVFVLSWMCPLVGLMIRLESRGPIFFKQYREGKNGSRFVCLKFRTMIQNEDSDTMWAARNDPRTTKFGSFLRRTSLDEFPQFLNVLIGQMSVVGPRPHPILLNDTYKSRVEKFAKRHESRPGVTGLAQAMGYRGEISDFYQMNSRVKLDRFYLQNWSFLLDIKIVFLTIFGIIKGQEKAY